MFMFDTKVATVRPYLLLGAAPHEQDYALLRGAGITHILQIGSELRSSYPDKFQYFRVSIDDAEYEDIIRHLPRCLEFIDAARGRIGPHRPAGIDDYPGGDVGAGDSSGNTYGTAPAAATAAAAAAPSSPGVVLVHCMAGMSRSASVVVSYLMWSEKLPYAEAFQQVKAARPCIYPNLGFLLQLWEWEASGCDASTWAGWNKHKFAERLAEYRRAQTAHGLHPAVRVRLPMPYDAGAASPSEPTAAYGSAATVAAASGAGGGPAGTARPGGGKSRRVGGVIAVVVGGPTSSQATATAMVSSLRAEAAVGPEGAASVAMPSAVSACAAGDGSAIGPREFGEDGEPTAGPAAPPPLPLLLPASVVLGPAVGVGLGMEVVQC